MKLFLLLTLFVSLSASAQPQTSASAQVAIPVGTVIPARLNLALESKKSKPGQIITASVAQDVPLDSRSSIKTGTRILGEIVAVAPASASQPATISLRFDKIDIAGNAMPIVTNLRALASPLEVSDAQTSKVCTERCNPPWSQTVNQIGQDVVYRGAGTVESGDEVVGKSVYAGNWGVMSKVSATPGESCRGEVGGNDRPQALWVFSHDACGLYGFDAVLLQAGRTDPDGTIVLASTKGPLLIRRDSGMLLRVGSN